MFPYTMRAIETPPAQEIEARIRNFPLSLRELDLGTESPDKIVVRGD